MASRRYWGSVLKKLKIIKFCLKIFIWFSKHSDTASLSFENLGQYIPPTWPLLLYRVEVCSKLMSVITLVTSSVEKVWLLQSYIRAMISWNISITCWWCWENKLTILKFRLIKYHLSFAANKFRIYHFSQKRHLWIFIFFIDSQFPSADFTEIL